MNNQNAWSISTGKNAKMSVMCWEMPKPQKGKRTKKKARGPSNRIRESADE